jgi:hypothetical protein
MSFSQVLGQAAIPHLGKSPQLLDDAKGMLAARAGARTCAVDQPPAPAQGRLGGGPPIDPIAHPASFVGLPVGLLPIRLVAKDGALAPVQQAGQLADVGGRRVGRRNRVDQSARVRADVELQPEVR